MADSDREEKFAEATRASPEQALGAHAEPLDEAEPACTHGVAFDKSEARAILGDWQPKTPEEFIMGNPRHRDVRKRFPRLDGPCPLGCGFVGIAYASFEHYAMGDW